MALNSVEVLGSDERAALDRLHFWHHRRDYAVAHDLLRRSLSRYAPVRPEAWTFSRTAFGKPYLPDGELCFNLSHTSGLVACAVTRAISVGIDVERIDPAIDCESVARHLFSAAEMTALTTCRADRRTRFFELWTLKEALLKAVGVGLAQPLRTVSFGLDGHESSIRFIPRAGYEAAHCQFALYAPSADARLAVAALGSLHPVRWRAQTLGVQGWAEMEPIRTSKADVPRSELPI